MTAAFGTWQDIRDEVLRRIHARDWPPGAAIPNEADLAQEFGVARATVNRALRELAATGLIERRRRAGSRVALHPVRRATLQIPVIRAEVEARGAAYGYALISRQTAVPPPPVRARMRAADGAMLHLRSLHLADGRPFMVEDRWIDPALPGVGDEAFEAISANEWLLAHAPYTHGDLALSAVAADARTAEVLGCTNGAALFVIERTTWNGSRAVTSVTQCFAPGYRMTTEI